MTTLIAAVNQISLGLAALSLNTATLIAPSDLVLNPDSLGSIQVSSINQATGELQQKLDFVLDKEAEPEHQALIVAAKTLSNSAFSPPESPYEDLFAKYASQFNVDLHLLKKIAWCESHYHFDSVGGHGAYGGMFQFSASTWASTRKAMGNDPNPDLRFDPEQAILTAAFKIGSGGIRAWPVCSTR